LTLPWNFYSLPLYPFILLYLNCVLIHLFSESSSFCHI
jgi:hypothetical protein